MKAVSTYKYGLTESLQVREFPKPQPGKSELCIKVHATTINRTDGAMLLAKPVIMRLFTGLFKPSKPVLGTDFAGVVESVGEKVSRFKVGQKVFGFNDMGIQSQAEYLVISEKTQLDTMPENIKYEKAAASLEAAHYAYNFLKRAKLYATKNVLINGASGAIGSALLLMVQNTGARVTAVCNASDVSRLNDLGVEKAYGWEQEDFTDVIDDSFDYVFDSVGKSTFGKCKPILNPGGIYISSELGPGGQNIFFALFAGLLKHLPGFQKKFVKFPFPSDVKGSIRYVKELIAKGKFDPVIDRVITIDEAPEAYNYVTSGKKCGNVVLQISTNDSN